MPEMMGALPDGDFLRSQTEAMLAKVAAEVGLADRCELVVAEGPPGPVLADSSSSDSVVVVGRYGVGQHHGLSRILDRVLSEGDMPPEGGVDDTDLELVELWLTCWE